MNKRKFKIYSICALFLAILYSVTYYFFEFSHKQLALGTLSILIVIIAMVELPLLWKKRKATQDEILTEAAILGESLLPLVKKVQKKPIYMLIGGKHSGKTTLLSASNAIKPKDQKNTTVTEYYSWHESEHACFIEPSSRLVFQDISDTDGQLWTTLVETIIDQKPRRPFAGVITSIDIEMLVSEVEEQKQYYTELLAERAHDIAAKVNYSIPTYVTVTKLDKLLGFSEFMRSSKIKSQVEHLTISLRDSKHNLVESYNNQYQAITKTFEACVIESTASERHWPDKQAIARFPKQFELCQSEILKVIKAFSELNVGKFSVDLRAIYFVSNLQSGRKYNLVAKGCSQHYNLPVIASEHGQLLEHSFFTRFLIDSHILPEANNIGENRKHLRKMLLRSRAALATCVTLVSLSGYMFYQSIDTSLGVIGALKGLATNIQATEDQNDFHERLNTATDYIEPFYEAWSQATSSQDDNHIVIGGQRLSDAQQIAERALSKAIEAKLIPLVTESMSLELVALTQNYNASLSLLKAYLMLSEVDKRENDFIVRQINRTLRKYARNQDSIRKATVFLNQYFASSSKSISINMDQVRASRRQLLTQSKVDMVYEQLLNEAQDAELGDLFLSQVVGYQFSNLYNHTTLDREMSIDKLYTSNGFSTFFRPRLELVSKQVIMDDWVLGLSNNKVPTEQELKVFRDDVIRKYSDDYITYWRNAVTELRLRDYDDIIDLTNAIDLSSGPTSPFSTVLSTLYANTKFRPDSSYMDQISKGNPLLEQATEALAEKVEDAIEPDYILLSRIEESFRVVNGLNETHSRESGTPWDEIAIALSEVRSYLKDITDAPNIKLASLNAAKSRMRENHADPLIRLKQVAQKTPEPVKSWLMDIVTQTWAILLNEAQQGVQELWVSEVWTDFNRYAADRYPFNSRSADEVSIDDFEAFFASAGTMDNFIRDYLSHFYDTQLWEPKVVDGEYLQLSQSFVMQLRNYNVINTTLFDNTTNRFNVPFHAKILDLDSSAIRSSMTVADETILYYHGPTRLKEFTWPPATGELSVNLMIQDLGDASRQHNDLIEGHWALFRMVNNARLYPSDEGGFISEHKIAGRDMQIHIIPSAPENPFNLRQLYNFKLPRNII
ncbi:type VI secretion system membrane subunit TssM [Vibrio sp. WXL103]|uniref:type VI secretion system membrane subunit TssM n=1 Tax=Vibrio sp. WXL103 TaxID=3450710 RepID=UPI003EC87268